MDKNWGLRASDLLNILEQSPALGRGIASSTQTETSLLLVATSALAYKGGRPIVCFFTVHAAIS